MVMMAIYQYFSLPNFSRLTLVRLDSCNISGDNAHDLCLYFSGIEVVEG